jgi:hypothetical protein
MCYALSVMLRGRCSCAISGRSTPSSFGSSSLLCPLTPLFPLDASHSPVTPLFPLDTQKQGGTPLPRASNGLLWYDQPFHFGVFPDSALPRRSPSCRPYFLYALSGESSFFSENSVPICQESAVSCKRAFLTPAVTTTSITIVGAPTFSFLHAIETLQPPPPPEGTPCANFEPSTFDFEPLFSPNSNHSRTYVRHARKSNYSRIYAKTRGWGSFIQMHSPITLLFSSTVLTSRLSIIVGAPTFPEKHSHKVTWERHSPQWRSWRL